MKLILNVILSLSSFSAFGIYADPIRLLLPENGIYHGAFPDIFEGDSSSEVVRKTREYESLSGKNTALITIGNHWFNGIQFPATLVAEIHRQRKVPVIEIMPWIERARDIGPDPVYRLERLVSGGFDNDLRQYALAAKAAQNPILLSFAPEMNGTWYPWSGAFVGGSEKGNYGDPALADGPELYRDAFKHLVQVFRDAGVENVSWIFHYTASDRPNEEWNQAENYYPGDQFVDWVGVSSYSAQQTRDVWEDFTVMMDDAYTAFEKMAPSKPFAVLEFGTIEDKLNPYRKSDWITNAFTAINSGRYPKLKAISYWHERSWDSLSDDFNLRIDSSTNALSAFVDGLAGGSFVSSPKITETQLPVPQVGCFCGFVNVNGIANCAAWRNGDPLLKEYQRWNRCEISDCKAFFSPATQEYCGGTYKAYRPR